MTGETAQKIAGVSRAGQASPADVSELTAPVDDDEDLSDAEIAAADETELDAVIAGSRPRRCKRLRGPAELTPAMHEFAARLACGENPFRAGLRSPCRYRRRAVRALLKSPLFVAAFERRRYHGSPTIEELRHVTRPGAPEPPASISLPMMIRTHQPAQDSRE